MHDRRVGAVAARHGATFGQMRVMQHNPGAVSGGLGDDHGTHWLFFWV